jgi:hypothetical protein
MTKRKTTQQPPTRPVGAITMRMALEDPALLGTVLQGDSWLAWRVLLIAALGEALTDDERVIFKKLTGREREPGVRCLEILIIAGRRGGKSRAIGCLVVYLGVFFAHGAKLAPGERAVLLCLAQNRAQAKVVFNYIVGAFEAVPLLAGLIENQTNETLSLSNGVEIEVRAASFRGLRGITAIAVVADEACFWYSEETGSANADSEILDAVRPSLATTGGLLVIISSPYAKKGEAYEIWVKNYGPDGDPRILVAQGASRDFNPSLPQKVVDAALARDPAAAASEYLGLWRSDLASFIDRAVIEAAVDFGVAVRPPRDGVSYVGFVDAASGSGKDSYTVGIAHADGDEIVLDLAHEIKPPFNPQHSTAEICALLKSYRIGMATGDKYSAGFLITAMADNGIEYRYSVRDCSQNFLESLPLLTAGRVRLIDNPRMVAQFTALERRTAVTGRDQVSHPRNAEAHDDLAAAVAGALVLATAKAQKIPIVVPFYSSVPNSFGNSGGMSSGISSGDWSNQSRFS